MTLVAAITLSSCSKQQDKSETEVPLKVTYTLDCSRDLVNLCDLVVTYKGDDGANAIDTITATPGDTTEVQTWTTVVETHQIPVKIGFDYNLVPKTDSLVISQPTARLPMTSATLALSSGSIPMATACWSRKPAGTTMPSESPARRGVRSCLKNRQCSV